MGLVSTPIFEVFYRCLLQQSQSFRSLKVFLRCLNRFWSRARAMGLLSLVYIFCRTHWLKRLSFLLSPMFLTCPPELRRLQTVQFSVPLLHTSGLYQSQAAFVDMTLQYNLRSTSGLCPSQEDFAVMTLQYNLRSSIVIHPPLKLSAQQCFCFSLLKTLGLFHLGL